MFHNQETSENNYSKKISELFFHLKDCAGGSSFGLYPVVHNYALQGKARDFLDVLGSQGGKWQRQAQPQTVWLQIPLSVQMDMYLPFREGPELLC